MKNKLTQIYIESPVKGELMFWTAFRISIGIIEVISLLYCGSSAERQLPPISRAPRMDSRKHGLLAWRVRKGCLVHQSVYRHLYPRLSPVVLSGWKA
jgi:hypothetical protein